ncbi:hypothetical protein SAMN05192549_110138 [Duganella sacchari]|uniref:Uncharacterized protein n=2 Tax=Duganella sacchari TaxID=551987 RepID=A0A1M7R4V9_9BURK|nr:hypothetical protein SAMN05192549_110138 [Duganella sacchari]
MHGKLSPNQGDKNFMMKLAISMLVVSMLTACGGGGSAGGASSDVPLTPSIPTVSQSSTQPLPTAGDYYTYRSTAPHQSLFDANVSPILTPEYFLYTSYFPIGGASATQLTQWGSPYFNAGNQVKFADGGIVNVEDSLVGCVYVYAQPWNEIPSTVTVDKSWETTTAINKGSRCSGLDMPGQLTTRGTAVAAETIQVAAGSFNTIKVVFQTSLQKLDGTITRRGTCWRDVASGMNVKCNIETVVPVGVLGGKSGNVTDELVSYSTAATGKLKSGVERFAGSWKDTFTSDESTGCLIYIEATGTIRGSCRSRYFPNVSLPVSGRIDTDGNADFTVKSSFGPTYLTHYKGKATDVATMNGTSDSTMSSSGEWRLKHF